MALEWLVHDEARRAREALPNALRVALASHDPGRVEALFPEFFDKSREVERTIRADEIEDPDAFNEMIEGKDVVFDVDMDPEQAKQLASLVGQGITEWTVSSDVAPSEGVSDDEGWV